jgi:hypothetical protein
MIGLSFVSSKNIGFCIRCDCITQGAPMQTYPSVSDDIGSTGATLHNLTLSFSGKPAPQKPDPILGIMGKTVSKVL